MAAVSAHINKPRSSSRTRALSPPLTDATLGPATAARRRKRPASTKSPHVTALPTATTGDSEDRARTAALRQARKTAIAIDAEEARTSPRDHWRSTKERMAEVIALATAVEAERAATAAAAAAALAETEMAAKAALPSETPTPTPTHDAPTVAETGNDSFVIATSPSRA